MDSFDKVFYRRVHGRAAIDDDVRAQFLEYRANAVALHYSDNCQIYCGIHLVRRDIALLIAHVLYLDVVQCAPIERLVQHKTRIGGVQMHF